MKQIRLTPRLDAVAGYVAPGAAVADIGTDHGYVPVWLAQNDLARRIVAADIGRGPLERARASARLYGVADQIEFIQTDGLDGLASAGLDTVILAGMGGQTMLGILARAAGHTRPVSGVSSSRSRNVKN
jgi:tRNA (adenine22-N1)-methyltransferase